MRTDDKKNQKSTRSEILSIKTLVINNIQLDWYNLDSIHSTMNFARDLIKDGCLPWTIVTAEQQITGRGTQGRDWISPEGKSLLLSLIVPPPADIDCINDLSWRTATILAESLQKFYKVSFSIKHPNDVLINGKKVAGILYESETKDGNVLSLILGLGLNLYQTQEDFDQAGLYDATSLFIEGGFIPEKNLIINTFIENFIEKYKTINQNREINVSMCSSCKKN